MAGLIDIKYDKGKLAEVHRMLGRYPKQVPKVMSRAVNRTATMARTEIISRMAEKLNLKKKTIREGLSLSKANYQNWVATIGLKTKRIPLLDYSGRQTAKGATYKIQKSGGRELVPSAFEAFMTSSHRGIFKRKFESRLPIMELFGPSLGRAFEEAPQVIKKVTKTAGRLLNKNINDQVKLLLEKRGA